MTLSFLPRDACSARQNCYRKSPVRL